MYCLSIETSAKTCSSAVISDGKVVSYNYVDVGLTHSVTSLNLCESVLLSASLSVKDLSLIAVSSGPGSFTGIRIGIAEALGMAEAYNIPCAPVSTLKAAAFPLFSTGVIAVPVMDARRERVYTAAFDCADSENERILEDDALPLSELSEFLLKHNNKKIILIGDGADISFEYLKDRIPGIVKASPVYKYQNAASVGLLGEKMFLENKTIPPRELKPFYLRRPGAEKYK